MKTYGRKRTEDVHDVILNLDELCRLCLAKDEKLLPIFNEDSPVPLPIRIMACVALEVIENDGLPKMICQACHYQLEKYYIFRKKCEISDIKLRRHLKKIKDKDLVSLNSENYCEDNDTVKITDESEIEVSKEYVEFSETKEPAVVESKDLVGPSVEYILSGNDTIDPEELSEDDEPSNITLPAENSERSEVTITQPEPEGEYLIESDEYPTTESTEILARAICATLDNISSGPDSSTDYPSTIEVITDDGTVIVMQLLSADEQQKSNDAITAPAIHIVNNNQELYMMKKKQRQFTTERGVTCELCGKWFTSRSALSRHFRVHTGEKPFICGTCGRSFAQKEILKRHAMIHMEVRPFTCDQCGRGFTQREPLRRHLQSHAGYGERQIFLHKCDHCPKVFCHPSGLSRHTSTHMGRKFKCRNCSRQFADKSSLRRHLKQSHHQDLQPSTEPVTPVQ